MARLYTCPTLASIAICGVQASLNEDEVCQSYAIDGQTSLRRLRTQLWYPELINQPGLATTEVVDTFQGNALHDMHLFAIGWLSCLADCLQL